VAEITLFSYLAEIAPVSKFAPAEFDLFSFTRAIAIRSRRKHPDSKN
jgi:hypothetical protein